MSLPKTWRRVDVLILIVAVVAVVLRNDRDVLEANSADTVAALSNHHPAAIRAIIRPYLRLASGFSATLIVTTVGLGLVAIRRPLVRPGRKWPGRGIAAIVVASLGLIYALVQILIGALTDPNLTFLGFADPHLLHNTLQNCEASSKEAVLGAWTLLALAGRWKTAEADGFERVGRVVGWCWIGSIAFDFIQAALW